MILLMWGGEQICYFVFGGRLEHRRAYELAVKLALRSVYWRCPYAGRQSLSLLLQRK
jgi:hypothetical protein